MKNLNFLIAVSIVIFYSSVNAQWVQMGPPGESVLSLAVSGSNVFAGTWDSGVYLSTDNGHYWTQTSLDSLGISSLVISGSNVFTVTYCYTCDPIHMGDEYNFIYLSTNSGLSWTRASLDSLEGIYSLAANGSNVFAGTSDGVYLSTDNGQNWIQTSLNYQYVSPLAINGSNIFAGTYDGVVFRSTDNGQNWTQTALNNQYVSSLAVSGSNVFAGMYDGVFRSTDNGQNWTQINLNNQNISELAVSGSNVFAGTGNAGVYLSTDNGETWSQINEGIGNQNIHSLAIGPNYIYAGTYGASTWRRPLSEIIISVGEQVTFLPNNFHLEQNYPNPFNPSTTIKYSIPNSEFGTLKVYDVLGNEVALLVNEEKPAGSYQVEFDASSLSSGIYFYQLKAGNPSTGSQKGQAGQGFVETRKMLLLK